MALSLCQPDLEPSSTSVVSCQVWFWISGSKMAHGLCSGCRIGDNCHAENFVGSCALLRLTSLAYFGGGLAKKGLGYFARYVPWLNVERNLLVLKRHDNSCSLIEVKPTPILLPINILEDFTKPLGAESRKHDIMTSGHSDTTSTLTNRTAESTGT